MVWLTRVYRYKCGHSYGYVCILIRFEHHWTFPHEGCNRVMRRAPKIDVGELESLAADYPEVVDKSRVSYSWDGLEFTLPVPFSFLRHRSVARVFLFLVFCFVFDI
jgi:hypothetical protein